MKPLCIFPVNYKGGVGKTTILTDLASELARKNHVLAIDTDPQGTLYTALGGDSKDLLPLYAAEDRGIISEFSGKFDPGSIKTFRSTEAVYERRYEKPKPKKSINNTTINFDDYFCYKYDVDLPAKMQFCYFPYFMFEERGDSFWKAVESACTDRGYKDCYEFVLIDLPPFRGKDVAAPVSKFADKFSGLFPLIITEPSKEELRIASESYELYRRVAEKAGIGLKTTPLWAINKCAVTNKSTFDGLDTRYDGKQHHVLEAFFGGDLIRGGIFEFPQVDSTFTGHQSVSDSKIFNRNFDFEGGLDMYSPISFIESDRQDESLDNNANYRNYLWNIENLARRIRKDTNIPAKKIGCIHGLSPEGKSKLAKIYSFQG